ncbi:MAG: M20/M25/M40 family metallo-hydrolase [Hyphomonadaceae bacterium]|nr:M20/M25/M40 family metallo-hydrolase [Hyphomonadaceae bacterium]
MKAGFAALLAATALAAACASVTAGDAGRTNPPPAAVSAALKAIAGEVSEANQRAYVEKMVSFGTRSTISDATSNTRGIGAARRWVETEFRGMASACSGCLEIVTPSDTVTGARYPQPTLVVDVVAIQRGTTDPNRVIIIQGHLDSRNSANENVTDDAPGANDDASGVAAVMESARILSKRKFPATIVYAALSGEEQGLSGGRILAAYAKAQGWQVEAVLNNDIVGNSKSINGRVDDKTVRVFSEGIRATETTQMAAARRSNGGELDSPSRNLSRYMATLAEQHFDDFRVRMIYRMDRYGRGGDQTPMQEAGFPAVRVTEGAENWNHQHQNIRTENGVFFGDTIEYVDFAYLARVTRLNAITLASLASAPRPPLEVKVQGALSVDTTVSWTAGAGPAPAKYVVWWRDTTSPVWQHSQEVAGDQGSVIIKDVVLDDHFYGVQAVSADGYASPIQFAGLLGAFFPPPAAAN